MIIVGERLNSSRQSVKEALAGRDSRFLVREAKLQAQAGAHYIDLNASALFKKETQALRWIVPLLQKNVKIPLSLDTPCPEAMGEALKIHRGRALLNSMSGEDFRIRKLLPIIREFNPRVIAVCLDDDGMPKRAEKALLIAQRLVDLLVEQGLGKEDIFVDPLLRPVGVDSESGVLFLKSLELIKAKLPDIKTIAGLSNVSFGLPQRRLLNRTFLILAIKTGIDAVICDPLDTELTATITASAALLGQDLSLRNYLRLTRKKPSKGRS